jgi:uncharacterized protein (TIGR00297 family)
MAPAAAPSRGSYQFGSYGVGSSKSESDHRMSLNILCLAYVPTGVWAISPVRIGFIFTVTVAFAGIGHLIHGVSRTGAIAGGVVCFVLFACAGPGAFAALFSVFALTWLATRLGRTRKQRLGTAERREGRTASQVVANLGIASLCAGLFAFGGSTAWLVAMAAALAEAAADTVASECGQAFSENARLITTFEPVPAGTDGGFTPLGTAAGAGAAILVSAVCALIGLPANWLWIPAVAGVFGMLADSYMGAVWERPGRINNDGVNFIGTAVAAGVAFGIGCIG